MRPGDFTTGQHWEIILFVYRTLLPGQGFLRNDKGRSFSHFMRIPDPGEAVPTIVPSGE
jgi:hypothetical protein